MINDNDNHRYNYRYNNIYMMNTKDKFNKKKMFVMIMLILIIFVLIFITKNVVETINKNIEEQKYQAQIEEQKRQEEEKEKQVKAKIAEEAEKKRQEKIPKLTQEGINNMSEIYHSEDKRAFLTFDDGPSNVTPAILDVLKSENIKATFFVLGSKVSEMPDMVKKIYEEGHYIANHGYTHSYSSIYSSIQAVLDEFNQCNEAVRKAIGVPEYNSHLFRFPGGSTGGPYDELKKEAKQYLKDNQILNIDWNALTGDAETTKPTGERIMQRLDETTQNKNSVVILMHDAQAKSITAEMLPQIISYLREQGYQFENFYQIIK